MILHYFHIWNDNFDRTNTDSYWYFSFESGLQFAPSWKQLLNILEWHFTAMSHGWWQPCYKNNNSTVRSTVNTSFVHCGSQCMHRSVLIHCSYSFMLMNNAKKKFIYYWHHVDIFVIFLIIVCIMYVTYISSHWCHTPTTRSSCKTQALHRESGSY